MARTIRVQKEEPLLDIGSLGRGAPNRPIRLPYATLEHIRRTVRRVPEVMVKVLPRGTNDYQSVRKHFNYIGRHGDLGLETDDGEQIQGKNAGRELMENWDLDLEKHRRQAQLAAARGREPPKLVHKLMFSMPAGTPPKGVLAAVRNLLREEFALKHRYAFVLHTDEPHPHVHVVVKAVSEDGVRLHIRKETLRHYRREFARHLREQGIAANATERAVRGQIKGHKRDGAFRAARRNASTHMRERSQAVAGELLKGDLRIEPGKATMVRTRKDVEQGWREVTDILVREGHAELAAQVRAFVDQMPPPLTEKEQIAAAILAHTKDTRIRERPPTR